MKKTRSIILIIFAITVFMLIALASTGDNDSSPDDSANENPTTDNDAEVAESGNENEENDSEIEDSFENRIIQAVQYNLDVANGLRPRVTGLTTEDAGDYHTLLGSLTAERISARLMGGDQVQIFRTFFYALHWRDAYIEEFGEDSYMHEAERFIATLFSESDIQLIHDYFAHTQEQRLMQNQQDEEDFRNAAITISYDSMIRNPSNYEGQIIKITVRIQQELVGGFLREAGFVGTESGNEWVITYDLPDGSPRILVGDTVTFYGEFAGLRRMERALTGVREYVPNMLARFHE